MLLDRAGDPGVRFPSSVCTKGCEGTRRTGKIAWRMSAPGRSSVARSRAGSRMRSGGTSTTVASGTRVPEATVVEVPPDRIRDPALDLATLLLPGADILHAIFPVRRVPSHPFVQTLEGNLTPGSPALSSNICVSRDHARRHGTNVFVYNGLDPADFIFRAAKDDYDLFLGRLHSVKGYRWAVA